MSMRRVITSRMSRVLIQVAVVGTAVGYLGVLPAAAATTPVATAAHTPTTITAQVLRLAPPGWYLYAQYEALVDCTQKGTALRLAHEINAWSCEPYEYGPGESGWALWVEY
jgi:hypothetical protein